MDQQQLDRLQFCRGLAAIAWTKEKTSQKVMDCELAEEFALILLDEVYKPNLGCATTRELKDELTARGPDSPDDYRTIDID